MNIKKISSTLLILISLVLFTGCVKSLNTDGLTLKIDTDELNANASSKFPIEKSFVVANVEIGKPNIYIKKDNKISASLNMALNAILLPTTKGSIEISGEPYFDKKESAIFLKHVEFEKLDFSNKEISKLINTTLLSSLKPIVDEIFKTIPIYKIEKDSFKGSFVKDIKVENKELLVTFGL